MIAKTFVPPNFVCRVRPKDTAERPQRRLERADKAEDLRARLEGAGYEVLDIAAYDFKTWEDAAKLETEAACRAIEAGEEYEFNDGIWTGLRDYLFRLFDGKCAYCEGKRGGVTPGSVEHYRPKGRVIEARDWERGYYWLAYDVTNYLPGCTTCNGKKSNHFPLQNEDDRARLPSDPLKKEAPLLLNPYLLSPEARHLSFVITWDDQQTDWKAKLVWVKAESPEGTASIKYLDLNREDLRTERAEVLNQVLLAIQNEFLRRDRRVVGELREGRREFSVACLAGGQEVQQGGGL